MKFYYEKRKADFSLSDQAEFDFRQQGVVIGDAAITGKIDKMRYDEEKKEILVFDYKTGRPMQNWLGQQEYEKIKAWKNKNQLIFYKILVENAREFKGKYKVHSGFLEFLEPVNDEIKLLSLDISEEETEKMKRLIRVVYHRIMDLDFPDVSSYDRSIEGIQSFIDQLLYEGKAIKDLSGSTISVPEFTIQDYEMS